MRNEGRTATNSPLRYMLPNMLVFDQENIFFQERDEDEGDKN